MAGLTAWSHTHQVITIKVIDSDPYVPRRYSRPSNGPKTLVGHLKECLMGIFVQ